MRRLRLAGIRICQHCARGRAELVDNDGTLAMRVTVDAIRAHELARDEDEEDLQPLSALVLEQLIERGAEPREVVFDVDAGRLRALLSYTQDDDAEIIECTPQEGISLAVRGGLNFYATDEALAHAAIEPRAHDDPDDSPN